jgi:hypothetical protein
MCGSRQGFDSPTITKATYEKVRYHSIEEEVS